MVLIMARMIGYVMTYGDFGKDPQRCIIGR
jgi:hypothetical protein